MTAMRSPSQWMGSRLASSHMTRLLILHLPLMQGSSLFLAAEAQDGQQLILISLMGRRIQKEYSRQQWANVIPSVRLAENVDVISMVKIAMRSCSSFLPWLFGARKQRNRPHR